MRFEEVTTCDYAATAVVDAMIWHLEDLAAFMDNVSEIKTMSFEEVDGPVRKIRTVRHWQGTASSVPALLRPFVTKNSLAWIDHGLWTPSEYKVEWRIESPHSKYSSCTGVNIFAPHPEAPEAKTRCIIAGDFSVHGDKLPAVPSFLGLKMAPRLESLILGFMMPNFRQLAVGLSGYLKDKALKAEKS
jgi:hypothetical protein